MSEVPVYPMCQFSLKNPPLARFFWKTTQMHHKDQMKLILHPHHTCEVQNVVYLILAVKAQRPCPDIVVVVCTKRKYLAID